MVCRGLVCRGLSRSGLTAAKAMCLSVKGTPRCKAKSDHSVLNRVMSVVAAWCVVCVLDLVVLIVCVAFACVCCRRLVPRLSVRCR